MPQDIEGVTYWPHQRTVVESESSGANLAGVTVIYQDMSTLEELTVRDPVTGSVISAVVTNARGETPSLLLLPRQQAIRSGGGGEPYLSTTVELQAWSDAVEQAGANAEAAREAAEAATVALAAAAATVGSVESRLAATEAAVSGVAGAVSTATTAATVAQNAATSAAGFESRISALEGGSGGGGGAPSETSPFTVTYSGSAWQYVSLAAAESDGYQDGQWMFFMGNPEGDVPEWAPANHVHLRALPVA